MGVLAIASGDATVKLFDIEKKVFLMNFEGHEDAVQDVVFEPNGKFLVSAGSDARSGCGTRVWSTERFANPSTFVVAGNDPAGCAAGCPIRFRPAAALPAVLPVGTI